MRKILLILFSILLLNGCAQSTALIGPVITAGSTGNVFQAGYSYGGNLAVKHSTGKTPGEHVTSYVIEKREKKKISKYLETHIKIMRNKLYLKSHIEKTRKKLFIKENS